MFNLIFPHKLIQPSNKKPQDLQTAFALEIIV